MRNYNMISRKNINMTAPTREELSDIVRNISSDALVLYLIYKSAGDTWTWRMNHLKDKTGWSESKIKRVRKSLIDHDYLFIEKVGNGLCIYHIGKESVESYKLSIAPIDQTERI